MINHETERLIYGITHDMGAPLRAVVQFSQLLESKTEERLSEKEKRWLELIQSSGKQAQRMLEALLLYSRLSSTPETEEPIDILSLIQATVTKLQGQGIGNSIQPQISGSIGSFYGIHNHWALFFYHTLKNAFLYQPSDQLDNTIVSVDLKEDASQQVIRIESNGIPVKPQDWIFLTQPFKRFQRQDEFSGEGMGLTYCEKIAFLHGGELTFDTSTLGGLAVIYTRQALVTEFENISELKG